MSTSFSDTFTGTLATLLENHTADSGGTWAKGSTLTAGSASLDGNGLAYSTSASYVVYLDSVVMGATVEYDVFFSFTYVATATLNDLGCVARAVSNAATFYFAGYDSATGKWIVGKDVAGVLTTLDSKTITLVAGRTYYCKLEVRDAAKKLYVDYEGTGNYQRVCYSTDNTITGGEASGNRVGMRVKGVFTSTTGLHFDNFSVKTAATVYAPDGVVGGYNPNAQQTAEADTTLGPVDISVEITKTPGLDGWITAEDANYAHISQQTGKFLPGFTASNLLYSLWMPGEGVIEPNEWNVEGWVKFSVAWNTLGDVTIVGAGEDIIGHDTDKSPWGWALYIDPAQSPPTLSLAYTDNTQNPVYRKTRTIPLSGSQDFDTIFAAGAWVNYQVRRTGAYLSLSLNGVPIEFAEGALVDVPTSTLAYGCRSQKDGIMWGGTYGRASSLAIHSDLRISRTARTVGVIPVLRTPTLTITPATATGATLRGGLRGAVGEPTYAYAQGKITEAVGTGGVVRLGKLLSCTPMKAGATDGTHPTAGHSGSFAYDWQVVDRSCAAALQGDNTIQLYISVGENVSLLGGAVAPFSGGTLTSGYARSGGYDAGVPNNLTTYGTLVSDLFYHLVVEQSYTVAYCGVGNEPDQGAFWTGTQLQFNQMYAAISDAVATLRSGVVACAGLKIGGPDTADEFDGFVPWVTGASGLIPYCKTNSKAIDFIAYHNYLGDSLSIPYVRSSIDIAWGTPGVLEIIVGEWDWNTNNAPGLGYRLSISGPDYMQSAWHGAYVARTSIIAQATTAFRFNCLYASTFTEGSTGFSDTGLIGVTHVGINHNIYRLIKLMGLTVIDSGGPVEIWPGVTKLATKDGSGNVYVFISYLRYKKDLTVPLAMTFGAGWASRSVTSHWIVGYNGGSSYLSDYYDGGAGHETLETVAGTTLDGSGNLALTLQPRSVNLLAISPTPPGGAFPFFLNPVMSGGYTCMGY